MSSGMTRRQADHLSPQRLTRGYYSSSPPTLHARASAILTLAGRTGVVCGPTALALAGVNLPLRLLRDTRVWVQVPPHQTWPRRAGVRLVRSSRSGPAHSVHGLPSLVLPQCWVQLAAESSLDELVELADSMMCRQRPVTTKTALRAALDLHDGARGIARARAAFDLCQKGTDSIPETDLRLLLVRAGLPTPTVNYCIVDDVGRVIYILDLAYEDKKVAIEYDGAYHTDRTQMNKDTARRRALEDQGWRIITVTSMDLATDPSGIIASVTKALSR